MATPMSSARSFLINPADSSKREEATNVATSIKFGAAAAGVGSVAAALFGAILIGNNTSIFGTLFLMGGSSAAVVSGDVFTIANNSEELLSSQLQRASSAISANALATTLLKGTLVAGPLGKNLAVRALNQKNS